MPVTVLHGENCIYEKLYSCKVNYIEDSKELQYFPSSPDVPHQTYSLWPLSIQPENNRQNSYFCLPTKRSSTKYAATQPSTQIRTPTSTHDQ